MKNTSKDLNIDDNSDVYSWLDNMKKRIQDHDEDLNTITNYLDHLSHIKPLLNKDTLWKPHALLLLGDYFVSKDEYLKAKEFYIQILSINNLQKELYDQASSQLALIDND